MRLELGVIFDAPSWPTREVRAKLNPGTHQELTLYWQGELSRLDSYLSERMPEEDKR